MLLFLSKGDGIMKKSRFIAIVSVFFSAVALVASVFELIYCVVKDINFLIMPIILVVVMTVVLVANVINLIRIKSSLKNQL